MVWMKRTGRMQSHTRMEFPGFCWASWRECTGKLGIYRTTDHSPADQRLDSQATSFILAMAMVGLGLNVHLKDVRGAWRPCWPCPSPPSLLILLTYAMA